MTTHQFNCLIAAALCLALAGCVSTSPTKQTQSRHEKMKMVGSYDWQRTVHKAYDQIFEQSTEESITGIAYPRHFSGQPHKLIRLDIEVPSSLKYILWIKMTTGHSTRRLMKADKIKSVDGDYYFKEENPDALSIFLDLTSNQGNVYKFNIAFIDSKMNVVEITKTLGVCDGQTARGKS